MLTHSGTLRLETRPAAGQALLFQLRAPPYRCKIQALLFLNASILYRCGAQAESLWQGLLPGGRRYRIIPLMEYGIWNMKVKGTAS